MTTHSKALRHLERAFREMSHAASLITPDHIIIDRRCSEHQRKKLKMAMGICSNVLTSVAAGCRDHHHADASSPQPEEEK